MSRHPSRIGPFRISRILGRGGTGVVYAATRDGTNERVALKVIHADRSHHRLIVREVAALSRLRHPQIVSVLDHGETDGAPWFAMELVEGEHLSQLADRRFGSRDRTSSLSMLTFLPGDELTEEAWPAEPTELVEVAGGRLPEALALVRALCEPLAFLHGEGLVHRDLKPENVLIRADGRPVLVDFGLASGFAARGREALDLSAMRAGTPPYMAPEQVRGASLDARTDLYALGCILYELLTGRPPFVGLRAAVMRAHLHEDPRPPSVHVSGVPPELDELCVSLLAKQRGDRVGYATEVASRLEALGARPPAWTLPPPRPYLYRPRLAARRQHVQAVEEGLAERGLTLIVGDSGLGKTRFVDAVARRWVRRGGTVITSVARGRGEGAALGAWRPALRALATSEAAVDALGPHREVLARFVPELGQAGTEALGAEAEHLRVVRAMAEALRLLATHGEVLLVIDDLHQADALSMDVLGWVARVGLALPVLATARPKLPAVLRELAADAHTVYLSPLDVAEVAAVAEDMLAVRPPDELVAWLSGLTDGNPFAIAEALRLAVAEGAVGTAGAPAELAIDGLPASLDELVRRRLAAVPEPTRPVLAAAAVLGPDLGATALGAMLGLSAEDAVAAAGPLLAADIVELHPSGALGWVHEPLWRAARASLDDETRRSLHRAAAAALEADGDAAWYPAIAWHLNTSGRPSEAARVYERAAEQALAQGALAEAERRFREAAELASGEDSRRIRFRLASRVLTARGENEQAQSILEAVRHEAAEADDLRMQGLVWSALTRIYSHASNPRQQLAAARTAVLLWGAVGDDFHLARARYQLGIALGDSGERRGARVAYEQALETFRRLGDDRAIAEALSNLALHQLGEGLIEEAHALYVEARTHAERSGHRQELGRILTNLATVAWRQSDLDEAVRLLTEAIGVHRALGARRAEGITLSNTAVALSVQGQLAKARTMFVEALAIDREVLNRRSEAWDLAELADVEMELGEFDAARAHLEEALVVAREVPEPYVVAHVLIAWVRFRRWVDGDLDLPEMAELIAATERAGRHGMTAQTLAERGHQCLASGEDAAEWLEAVRGHIGDLVGDAEADDALERLVDAAATEAVVHGEAVIHLPEAVRRHLGLSARR